MTMIALGIALALLNVYTSRRDLALATGPPSVTQRRWLIDAAERPDIAQFFKGLTPERKLGMARAIGRYDDAPLAKLCGLLLADFDEEARAILVSDMKRIAAAHPEAVAAQLVLKGGFQTLGVSEALRSQGSIALPDVAAMLDDADARPTAVDYLVKSGEAAVPPLLKRLDDPKPEVRLAAADALGGLRASAAVAPLLKRLADAAPDERTAYLTAISAIGDPSTASLLESILEEGTRPLPERTAAAVGLGRVGGIDAARSLLPFATSDEPVLATAAQAALTAVGSVALTVPNTPFAVRIRLAGRLEGDLADATLRNALAAPGTRSVAAKECKGRPRLVPDLFAILRSARGDGDLAATLIADLRSTPEGRLRLAIVADDPLLSGFIARARA